MKTLLVYSSRTGNTQKIAEAMASVLPECTIAPVSESIDYQDFDVLILGYWVDKGMPDKESIDFLQRVKNCRVVLFGTLGASVESDHAAACIKKAEALVFDPPRDNMLCGSWICRGKVDPKLYGSLEEISGARRERIVAAMPHPDEEDCKNAQHFICDILANIATA